MKEQYEAPTTKKEITKELRKARQEIRILWKKKRSLRSTVYEDQEQAFIESHPKMDPKKAKAIFKKSELTNEMMAELPKRKHHSGGLNSIAVPVPREGLKIEYQSLSDPVLVLPLSINFE